MCSPELRQGSCEICFGTVTPETAHANDLGLFEDLHRGKCTLLAGIYPSDEIARRAQDLIERAWELDGPRRDAAIREYYSYIGSVATEDFYEL